MASVGGAASFLAVYLPVGQCNSSMLWGKEEWVQTKAGVTKRDCLCLDVTVQRGDTYCVCVYVSAFTSVIVCMFVSVM